MLSVELDQKHSFTLKGQEAAVNKQYLSEGRKEKGGEQHIVGNLLLARSFLETYVLTNLSSMLEVSGL